MKHLGPAAKATLRRVFHEAHVNVEGLIDAYRRMPDDPVAAESRDFLRKMDALSEYLLGEPVQTLTNKYGNGERYTIQVDGSLKKMDSP